MELPAEPTAMYHTPLCDQDEHNSASRQLPGALLFILDAECFTFSLFAHKDYSSMNTL
jgi:hypothetical protein